MRINRLSTWLCATAAARHGLASSFYDNPEQDALYNEAVQKEDNKYLGWPEEELKKKWGNDVRF